MLSHLLNYIKSHALRTYLPQADLVSARENMERRDSEYEEVSSQLARKSETEEKLQQELENLQGDLARLREAEEMLQRSVASKERKVSHLEERLADMQDSRNKRSDSVSTPHPLPPNFSLPITTLHPSLRIPSFPPSLLPPPLNLSSPISIPSLLPWREEERE